MTSPAITAPELQAIIKRNLEADRALKQARAEAVLEYQDDKVPVMWAKVELDTHAEAQEADEAKAEWLSIWALIQLSNPHEGFDGGA